MTIRAISAVLGWKNVYQTFRQVATTAGKMDVQLVKKHAKKGAKVPYYYRLTVRVQGYDLHKLLANGVKLDRSTVAAIKHAARASR